MASQSHPDLTRALGRAAHVRGCEDFDIRARCITTGLSVLALIVALVALFLL